MEDVTNYLRLQYADAWKAYLAARKSRRVAQKSGVSIDFYRWDLEAARCRAAYERAGEHLRALRA